VFFWICPKLTLPDFFNIKGYFFMYIFMGCGWLLDKLLNLHILIGTPDHFVYRKSVRYWCVLNIWIYLYLYFPYESTWSVSHKGKHDEHVEQRLEFIYSILYTSTEGAMNQHFLLTFSYQTLTSCSEQEVGSLVVTILAQLASKLHWVLSQTIISVWIFTYLNC
jgi:hypothetical protein